MQFREGKGQFFIREYQMAIGFSCRPHKKISSQVLDLAKIDFAKSTINAATFKGLNRIEKKNSQCEAIFKCNDNYCWLQFLIIGGHLCGYGCSTYELDQEKTQIGSIAGKTEIAKDEGFTRERERDKRREDRDAEKKRNTR